MNIYHYDQNCHFVRQSEATYDALDGSINIPANSTNSTTLIPLGAVSPDVDVFDVTENCWKIEKHIEPPKPDELPPPTLEELRAAMILTPAQFRMNLVKAGLFDEVSNAIATLPNSDPAAILWEYALQFERLNPVLIELANKLDYGDDELDAVFTMKTL